MKTEPSVLDFLKSRMRFWDKSGWISIPQLEESTKKGGISKVQTKKDGIQSTKQVLKIDDDFTAQKKQQKAVSVEEKPLTLTYKGYPWRATLAVVSAIFGQAMWEPQTGNLELGFAFYVIGISLAVWAVIKKEWSLAALPLPQSGTDTMSIRLWPFLAGIILSVVAFLDFGGNLFTWHNVLFWMGAIGLIVYSFFSNQHAGKERKRILINRKTILWAILIIVITALVIFFRVYQLNSVPSEPISDHAEKILDVYDITQGQTHIFFPRNTGREAIQMYLTLVISWIFKTGLSFLSLKIGTVICGLLTLPYLFLLGKEFGGKTIGIMAVLLAGIAYWPNIISRFGLRFPLYPLFVAPTLYYLIRGLRTHKRNDFIAAGIFLGFGLHGYSPFRIVPLVVLLAIGIFLLHRQSNYNKKITLLGLVILAFISFIVFLPLARYWVDNPSAFSYRAFSRLGAADSSISGSPLAVLVSNSWNALRMFNWDDGSIWVISVAHRPALDIISGALFILGVVLIIARYIQKRNWLDLFILMAVPLLALPSILSLAFPDENPALNRASAAFIPVFLIIASAFDGFINGIIKGSPRKLGIVLASVIGIALVGFSVNQNFDLVFKEYASQYSLASWNSSEMGEQIVDFKNTYGTTDSIWVVAYPNRVDTRLPGIWAGIPNRDFGIWPDQMAGTLALNGPKLFLLWPDDTAALSTLEQLYPIYDLKTIQSKTPGHDFLAYFIPGNP